MAEVSLSSGILQVGTIFLRHGIYYEVVDVDALHHLVRCNSRCAQCTFSTRPQPHPLFFHLSVSDIEILLPPERNHSITHGPISDGIETTVQDPISLPVLTNQIHTDINAILHGWIHEYIVSSPASLSDHVPTNGPGILQQFRPGLIANDEGEEDDESVPSLRSQSEDESDTMPSLERTSEDAFGDEGARGQDPGFDYNREVDNTAFRIGRRFYRILDVNQHFEIVMNFGTPIHTVHCRDLGNGTILIFKTQPHGNQRALPLYAGEMVDM